MQLCGTRGGKVSLSPVGEALRCLGIGGGKLCDTNGCVKRVQGCGPMLCIGCGGLGMARNRMVIDLYCAVAEVACVAEQDAHRDRALRSASSALKEAARLATRSWAFRANSHMAMEIAELKVIAEDCARADAGSATHVLLSELLSWCWRSEGCQSLHYASMKSAAKRGFAQALWSAAQAVHLQKVMRLLVKTEQRTYKDAELLSNILGALGKGGLGTSPIAHELLMWLTPIWPPS